MRRLWIATGLAFAAAVLVDVVMGAGRPGLTASIGLLGCLGIIVGSKWLGKALLQRREGYYEGGRDG